jgi:hypothetical protein
MEKNFADLSAYFNEQLKRSAEMSRSGNPESGNIPGRIIKIGTAHTISWFPNTKSAVSDRMSS